MMLTVYRRIARRPAVTQRRSRRQRTLMQLERRLSLKDREVRETRYEV